LTTRYMRTMRIKHGISILLIVVLLIVSWYQILRQSLIGGDGGFQYFIHPFFTGDGGLPLVLFRPDAGARLLYELVVRIFGDNIVPFQYIALIGLIVVCISFYFLVYQLTSNKPIALLSTILFGVNFTTTFEMVAIGSFAFFAQRMIQLVPQFISLVCFDRSVRGKNRFLAFFSILFFILAFLLAQYSMLFVPFFFLYLFSLLIAKKHPVSAPIGFSLLFVFAVVSYVLLFWLAKMTPEPPYSGSVNLALFWTHYGVTIPSQLLRQLTILTIPDSIIRYGTSLLQRSYNDGIVYLYLPVLGLYAVIGAYLYRKETSLRSVMLSCLLYFPVIFFLNLFIRGDEVTKIYTSSRYLHLASISFSIFWGIFLFVLVKSSFAGKILGTVIILLWIIYNTVAIRAEIQKEFYQHIAVKKSLEFVKSLAPYYQTDSIVIVPSPLSYYGSYFAQMFYGKDKTVFAPYFSDWANTLPRPFDPNRDFIFDYDSNKSTVTDRTNEYKSIIAERTTRP